MNEERPERRKGKRRDEMNSNWGFNTAKVRDFPSLL